jgi:site-specific DNA-methyltransferase (adenine-specific)
LRDGGRSLKPQITDPSRAEGSKHYEHARAGANSAGAVYNHHPTVKPLDLCRYLATMLLPPARETPRRLLVPFSGSGSEMIGALRAGWDHAEGIERDPDYIAIAHARLKHHLAAA